MLVEDREGEGDAFAGGSAGVGRGRKVGFRKDAITVPGENWADLGLRGKHNEPVVLKRRGAVWENVRGRLRNKRTSWPTCCAMVWLRGEVGQRPFEVNHDELASLPHVRRPRTHHCPRPCRAPAASTSA